MILYFAALGGDVLRRLDHPNVLIAYPDQDFPSKALAGLVFRDSGAFTAFRGGKPVVLAEYIEDCYRNRDRVDVIAALDVINDPVSSRRNYLAMMEAGIDALPTYHIGTDWSYYKWLLDRYPYIAIGGVAWRVTQGGVVGKHSGPIMRALVRCHQWARTMGVRLHGFGITAWDYIAGFPWYSIDSSTFLVGARFGFLLQYERGKLTQALRPAVKGRGPERKRLATYLARCGFDHPYSVDDLFPWEDTPAANTTRCHFNCLVMQHAVAALTRAMAPVA